MNYKSINCHTNENKDICEKNVSEKNVSEKDVSEIYPGLWLGNYKSALSYKFVKEHNIKCIMNVTKDIPNLFENIEYFNIPINDDEMCSKNTKEFIKLYNISTEYIKNCLVNGKNILVHCKRGHHRSACIVAAYLIKYHDTKYTNAINYINSIRKYALVRNTYMVKGLYKYSINCCVF